MSADPMRRHKVMAWSCVVVVGLMVGLSFAAVPLYDLFCRVTGYGGTTQRAESGADHLGKQMMTVQFDASTARDMPWQFRPEQREVRLRTGETGMAFYRASNPTDRAITGTATFNVSPPKVGLYFVKLECFCFTEQTLEPGQSVDMPVQFYVDPEIENDPNAREVKTITLSYTFFVKPADEARKEVRVSAVQQ
ncbi:MAG: cytochrome c oxidase assembly protein [Pseudomonadota bacterium]|nr:cytochrome c oxidase assembly protein [Pseudomonadota bacterium]